MLFDLDIQAKQADVALIVGISQPTISVLMSEGKIPAAGTLRELIHAYCHRLREQAAGRLGSEVGGLDLSQERAALAREQRMGYEIKNAVLRSEYAPIGLLAEVLATASQSIVERLEQLPGQLKKACPELPESTRDVLMTALASARNEWVRATTELVTTKLENAFEDDAGVTVEDDPSLRNGGNFGGNSIS